MNRVTKTLIAAATIGLITAGWQATELSQMPLQVASTASSDSASLPAITTNAVVAGGDRSFEESLSFVSAEDVPVGLTQQTSGTSTQGTVGGAVHKVTRVASGDAADQSAQQQAAAEAKMSGQIAALAAAGGDGLVEVIVRYDSQPELFEDGRIADLGGEVMRDLSVFGMRAIRIPAKALHDLAVERRVDWLSLDETVRSFSQSSRETANQPTYASANVAYSGFGVGVAVLDSGVAEHADLDHQILQYSFLNGRYPQPVIQYGVVLDDASDVRGDVFGHGTHVAGIVTGSGIDSGNQFTGIAPDATLVSLQVLDGDGAGQMSDVIAALDWLLVYGADFDIRVVNLSLGKQISESNQTDPLVIAAERLWDAGFVVVVAAGNDGKHGDMTINSPGNSRKVITVGSVTDNSTGRDFQDDQVSRFSSRGPTVGDLVAKPDLLAPGDRIVAAVPTDSMLVRSLPSRTVNCARASCNSIYLKMSGTSMAAPIVSATAALMLQKDPTLSPATVKARLMRSARKISGSMTANGAGVLDVNAAMDDAGVVNAEALSPLLLPDAETKGVLIEDTGVLWGDSSWSVGYLFDSGFGWSPASTAGDDGIGATGYLWTDGGVGAKGYLWTDERGVGARGYLWTDEDEEDEDDD